MNRQILRYFFACYFFFINQMNYYLYYLNSILRIFYAIIYYFYLNFAVSIFYGAYFSFIIFMIFY